MCPAFGRFIRDAARGSKRIYMDDICGFPRDFLLVENQNSRQQFDFVMISLKRDGTRQEGEVFKYAAAETDVEWGGPRVTKICRRLIGRRGHSLAGEQQRDIGEMEPGMIN